MRPSEPTVVAFSSFRAEPTVNEQGALEACEAVVESLNQGGAEFGQPVTWSAPEEGVDCVSTGARELWFQVTRAMRNPAFWQHLRECEGATMRRDRREIADDLWDAIQAKANRIPQQARSTITLVLDASDLPAHNSLQAAQDFESGHGAKARALGFESIWVSCGLASVVRARIPGTPGVHRLA